MVELLVVIGVISVLAGLLLPTLSRTKDSAKKIMCLNNQRQIGIGISFYANNWGGYLPVLDSGAGSPDRYWIDKVHTELGGDVYTGDFGKADSLYAIFLCPSMPISNEWWQVDGRITWLDPNYGASYAINGKQLIPLGQQTISISKIRSPSSKLLVLDYAKNISVNMFYGYQTGSMANIQDYIPGGADSSNGIVHLANGGSLHDAGNGAYLEDFASGRHTKKNNVLMVDCHAMTCTSEAVADAYYINTDSYKSSHYSGGMFAMWDD